MARFVGASFMFEKFTVEFLAQGREVRVRKSVTDRRGKSRLAERTLDNMDRIYKPCVKHCLLAFERAFPTGPDKRTTPNIHDKPLRFALKLVKD